MPTPPGVFVTLNGVWGSGPDDVFAVGYDGQNRASRRSELANHVIDDLETHCEGVWGRGPDDVFAVGDNGTVVHLRWNELANHAIGVYGSSSNGVWGSGPDDVFAAAYGVGCIRRLHRQWRQDRALRRDDLANHANAVHCGLARLAVWGNGPDDVFAVGYSGTLGAPSRIARYDGASWQIMPLPITTETFHGVWGSGPDDVFAVGWFGTILHYDGTNWQTMPSATSAPAHMECGEADPTTSSLSAIPLRSCTMTERVGAALRPHHPVGVPLGSVGKRT